MDVLVEKDGQKGRHKSVFYFGCKKLKRFNLIKKETSNRQFLAISKIGIYRLSYITNTPVKDVAEILFEKGLRSRKVIEYLSKYFRRDFQFLNTVYMGDGGKESLQNKYQSGKKTGAEIH